MRGILYRGGPPTELVGAGRGNLERYAKQVSASESVALSESSRGEDRAKEAAPLAAHMKYPDHPSPNLRIGRVRGEWLVARGQLP